MPLSYAGISADHVVSIDATKSTITAADGTQWNTKWRIGGGGLMWPDRDQELISVEVPTKFFNQAKTGVSRIEMNLALSVYREENFRDVRVQPGEFRVPGVGICAANLRGSIDYLFCRTPMKDPAVIASINTSMQTCPPSPDKPSAPPGVRITAERMGESSGPAEVGISPVQTTTLYFLNWMDPQSKMAAVGPCPGTPVRFSTPVLEQRVRVMVQLEGLRLSDCAYWSQGSGWRGGGYFVGW